MFKGLKKKIIAVVLAFIILFTGVSAQYSTAEAVAWELFASVPSLGLPFGLAVIAIVVYCGHSFDVHDQRKLEKIGDDIWTEFENFIKEADYQLTENQKSFEALMHDLYESDEALREDMELFIDHAKSGMIDTTSGILELFDQWLDSNVKLLEKVVLDSSIDASAGRGGFIVKENTEYWCDNFFAPKPGDEYEYTQQVHTIKCDSDVYCCFMRMLDLSEINTRYCGSITCGMIFYSLSPFVIQGAFGTKTAKSSCTIASGSKKFGEYYYSYGHLGSATVTQENVSFVSPAGAPIYSSWEEIDNMLLGEDAVTIPGPLTWDNVPPWEKDQDQDFAHDDVIILNPPGVSDHAEENPSLQEQLENILDKCLEGELPWSAFWDFARPIENTDNPQPPEGDKENEKENEENKPSSSSSNNNNPNGAPILKGIEKIFPFCIPFDIYKAVQVLDADPVAPHLTYKFKVMSKTYDIDIDLKKWDSVAKIFRLMQCLAFCVGLAMVTRSHLIKG